MFDEVHEVIGWIGMFLILCAYAGVSLGFMSADILMYQVINGIGAGALLYSAYKTSSYPLMGLNIAWLIIAIIALLKIA